MDSEGVMLLLGFRLVSVMWMLFSVVEFELFVRVGFVVSVRFRVRVRVDGLKMVMDCGLKL